MTILEASYKVGPETPVINKVISYNSIYSTIGVITQVTQLPICKAIYRGYNTIYNRQGPTLKGHVSNDVSSGEIPFFGMTFTAPSCQ